MVADVIVARHKRGAITRISLCFISCSLNETTCKTYKRDTRGIPDRLSHRVVTNAGAVAGGHTTPPCRGRQPPKVQDLSVFRTFRDERRDDPRNWDRHKCRGDESVIRAKVSDRTGYGL